MPSAIQDLYATLHEEKRALVRQAVTDNKFHRLPKDDKLHVSEMSDELKHYEQYIKDLREAKALNTFVRMVIDFCHIRFREIRNELRELHVPIRTWDLRTTLQRLEPIVLRHDQLMAHLRSQLFRGWHICCRCDDGKRYRCQYAYNFPKCEFGCPLIIRNCNLWIQNVIGNMYAMIDLFSKLCGTRVYVLDRCRVLWLGRRTLQRDCYVREASSDRLWLGIPEVCATATDDRHGSSAAPSAASRRPPKPPGHCSPCDDDRPPKRCCIEYDAVWIPEFQLYIRLRKRTLLRDSSVCIRWCDTVLSREQIEGILHYFAQFRAGEIGNGHGHCCDDADDPKPPGSTLAAELYLSEHVDWELFTPLKLEWLVRNKCGDAMHTESLRVHNAEVRNCTTLEGDRSAALSPGFCGRIRNIHVALRHKRWPSIILRLVHFYDDVIDRIEAMQRRNDNEKRQVENWMECVHSNICMQKTLIVEYIGSNRKLVDAKIMSVNKLIASLEELIAKGYE